MRGASRRASILIAIVFAFSLIGATAGCVSDEFGDVEARGVVEFAANRSGFDEAAQSIIERAPLNDDAVLMPGAYGELSPGGDPALYRIGGRTYVVFPQRTADPDHTYVYVFAPRSESLPQGITGADSTSRRMSGDWWKAIVQ